MLAARRTRYLLGVDVTITDHNDGRAGGTADQRTSGVQADVQLWCAWQLEVHWGARSLVLKPCLVVYVQTLVKCGRGQQAPMSHELFSSCNAQRKFKNLLNFLILRLIYYSAKLIKLHIYNNEVLCPMPLSIFSYCLTSLH